ncbi:MAG: hypothetical protein UHK60_06955 [Acutalibacteraceae bacterium]|nr:hypothetical protein [Acutalibacteraceae bacterium]
MKSKEEIKKDEEEFYRIQELVLNAKTQEERTKYAWQMYPIIKSAMASALKQRANNHFIYDYENVLEELTETLVERFIKRPKRYNFFKTLIYYKSLDYWLPKYREIESLDEFLENKEMNEDRLCYVRDEETGMYSLD